MLPIPEFVRPVAKKVIGLPGRYVPYALQKQVLSVVLNQAFREPLRHGELDFLEDAKVRIKVTDLCIDWLIRVGSDKFTPLERNLKDDVCISGESLDFILLATTTKPVRPTPIPCSFSDGFGLKAIPSSA